MLAAQQGRVLADQPSACCLSRERCGHCPWNFHGDYGAASGGKGGVLGGRLTPHLACELRLEGRMDVGEGFPD